MPSSTVPPMVDLDTMKTWLRIEPLTVTTYDALLTMMINATSAKIAQFCDTDFATHVVAPETPEIIDGGRADIIVPRYLPLISIQALRLGVDTQGLGGLDLDTSDYQINQWGITLKRLNSVQGRATVALAYTGGYAAVPDDVSMACMLTVEAMYLRRTQGRTGVSSRTKAVGSGTSEAEQYLNAWDMDTGLPKEAVALLQSHKNFEWPSDQTMAARNY